MEIKVEGMSCCRCVASVRGVLEELDGVESVQVDLANGLVKVVGSASREAVVQAIEDVGYVVK
ncbi:MAG: heavy-metal-associated domain-containing protein [Limnochordia bacterium]|jgi:copper chaperone